MLPLPSAETYKTRLPREAGILELRDTTIPAISGMRADAICSSYSQYGLREPVSILAYNTGSGCSADGPERPRHGSRSRAGLIGRDFRDPRACLCYYTTDWASGSVSHTEYVLVSRLWAMILFDSGASHSFIAASCVNELGLEVETLRKSLYVSSPLGTKVTVDQICRDCELEISRVLLTVDLRVIDMSEFDVILGMDWLTAHWVVIDCDRRRVTAYTQDGVCVMFQGDK